MPDGATTLGYLFEWRPLTNGWVKMRRRWIGVAVRNGKRKQSLGGGVTAKISPLVVVVVVQLAFAIDVEQ